MSTHPTQPDHDDVDRLMSNLFERAMVSVSQIDLMDEALDRIRRRQRQRLLLMTLVCIIAVAVCVINGLPVLGMLLNGLSSANIETPASIMPGLFSGLIALLGMGCVHLLLEDAI